MKGILKVSTILVLVVGILLVSPLTVFAQLPYDDMNVALEQESFYGNFYDLYGDFIDDVISRTDLEMDDCLNRIPYDSTLNNIVILEYTNENNKN